MEKVQRIQNIRPNEVHQKFQALKIPQEVIIKEILIITDEAEEAQPQKKISKWAKFAKEEPGYLEGLSGYIEKCSREIRDNFAFKSELAEN